MQKGMRSVVSTAGNLVDDLVDCWAANLALQLVVCSEYRSVDQLVVSTAEMWAAQKDDSTVVWTVVAWAAWRVEKSG